jgi:hypothetical protein
MIGAAHMLAFAAALIRLHQISKVRLRVGVP